MVEGAGDPDAWCKADAVADALTRASGDLLVIADADCWCDGTQDAIDAVQDGALWAVPHNKTRRLDAQLGIAQSVPLVPGGGIVVLPRVTYEQIPLDPRFVGWGGEDAAWGKALFTLAGECWRGKTPLVHYWHPPAFEGPRHSRSFGNRDLWLRYCAAENNRPAMRTLIEEARCEATRRSSSSDRPQ